jgi:hypothetical protein
MAATNYTPIQLYYSTTASAAPTSGNLASGELAINITDGKLYYKDNGGVVQVIATKGAGTIGGSTTQIQYNNAGALAGNAAMTFNSATSTTTLTTLNLTNALGATYGGTAQSAYTQGDILYASATNTLSKLAVGTVNYILTSTGSVPQWVAPTSVTVNTATNLAGGAAGSVPYQSGAATTTFLAIGAADRVMTSSGTAPQWVTALTGLTGISSSSITNTSLTAGRVVYSSTAGLETDSANLTFNGTTLSTTGFSNTGFSTLVKTLTLGDSNFNGTAVFAPATPAKMYFGTGTVTDVTSAASATNAAGAVVAMGITPIAATNASVTYTNASTLYIAGAPSAGTNVTITNPYSLYIAAGAAYFGGAVTYAGGINFNGNVTVGDSSADTLTINSTITSNLIFTDNTYDIGASGATRPRNLYLSGNAVIAGSTTLSGGTANGVAYLNGSKVLTTGSALVFDGSTLTSGASGTASKLILQGGAQTSMSIKSSTGTGGFLIGRGYGSADENSFFIYDIATSQNRFYIDTTPNLFQYATAFVWSNAANSTEYMRLTSTGLGIGTSSPSGKLDVRGTVIATPAAVDQFGFQMLKTGTSTTIAGFYQDTTNNGLLALYNTSAQQSVSLSGASANALTLDSIGNLGLGTTATNIATYRVLAIGVGSGGQGGILQFQGASGADGAHVRLDRSGSTITGFNIETRSGSNAPISLLTNSVTAVTIDTSQNVGIGTITPTAKLQVVGTATNGTSFLKYDVTSANSSFNWVSTAFASNMTTGNLIHFIGQAGSSNNAAYFGFQYNGSTSANNLATIGLYGSDNLLNVNANGNVSLKNATTSGSGIGITFPATQSASSDANTLDDYEEGTWTPVLGGTGSNPTVSYSYRSGVYRKIGSMVYVQFGILLSSISGGSGEMALTGLPFTSLQRNSYQEPSNSLQGGGWVNAAYAGQTYMFVNDNSTQLGGRYQNNSDTAIGVNQFQAGTYFNGMIVYLAQN